MYLPLDRQPNKTKMKKFYQLSLAFMALLFVVVNVQAQKAQNQPNPF